MFAYVLRTRAMLIEKWRCERVCLLSALRLPKRTSRGSSLADLSLGRCCAVCPRVWHGRLCPLAGGRSGPVWDLQWAGLSLAGITSTSRKTSFFTDETSWFDRGRGVPSSGVGFHVRICFTGTSEVVERAPSPHQPPKPPHHPWPLMSSTENKCHR